MPCSAAHSGCIGIAPEIARILTGFQLCRYATLGQKCIMGERTETTPVGEDREALAVERLLPTERLGGIEQFVEAAHAQQPGPAEGGIMHGIGCASLAVWVSAWRIRRERSPGLMITTGLTRAAARAADMNLRGAEIVSTCSRIARLCRSVAK